VGEGKVAFDKLGKVLSKYMLRRTKLGCAEDLGLPPRDVIVRRDYFNDEERDFYASLYSDTKRQFATYVAEGTVLNNVANVFDLLTKMRQAANHPAMITTKLVKNPVRPATSGNSKDLDFDPICGLCHEPAEDPIIAKCKHVFCRVDVQEYLEGFVGDRKAQCPVCYTNLVVNLDDIPDVIPVKKTTSIVQKLDMKTWRSSTKIEALVEELYLLRAQGKVYCQFT
jgi:DNA repair protein RAD16